MNTKIIDKVKEYINKTFRETTELDLCYHNFAHTAEVAKITTEIANAVGVNDNDREALLIAAWFHDIGHTKKCEGHEEVGIEIAEKFLRENDYPIDGINKVKALINVTGTPGNPKNTLEEIICDADLHHLGTNEFEKKAELLKKEIDSLQGTKLSEVEWLTKSLKFLEQHQFYTDYAKHQFDGQKRINYLKIRTKLDRILNKIK